MKLEIVFDDDLSEQEFIGGFKDGFSTIGDFFFLDEGPEEIASFDVGDWRRFGCLATLKFDLRLRWRRRRSRFLSDLDDVTDATNHRQSNA